MNTFLFLEVGVEERNFDQQIKLQRLVNETQVISKNIIMLYCHIRS